MKNGTPPAVSVIPAPRVTGGLLSFMPKATSARAARAGASGIPRSDRNLARSRSGMRFARYSSASTRNAKLSRIVTPGSDGWKFVHSGLWTAARASASSSSSW